MTEAQKARAAAALLSGVGVVECGTCGAWVDERDARFYAEPRVWWRCRDCTPFMDRRQPAWLMVVLIAADVALCWWLS